MFAVCFNSPVILIYLFRREMSNVALTDVYNRWMRNTKSTKIISFKQRKALLSLSHHHLIGVHQLLHKVVAMTVTHMIGKQWMQVIGEFYAAATTAVSMGDLELVHVDFNGGCSEWCTMVVVVELSQLLQASKLLLVSSGDHLMVVVVVVVGGVVVVGCTTASVGVSVGMCGSGCAGWW